MPFTESNKTIVSTQPSIIKAFLWATVLVLLDAFLLNQGVIAGLVALCAIFVHLPLLLVRRKERFFRQRIVKIGIYLTAALFVFALNYANNRLARHRAEKLVVAIDAYKSKYARYPTALQELIPEFVDHVPLAKYTFVQNTFHYRVSERGVSLFYVALPPFGRPTYSFASGAWSDID